MKRTIVKALSTLASFAFAVSVFSGGTASIWALHQEKEPEALSKFIA